ncbi:hypothetical protein EDC04DRAFT_3096001 [Pisolithus marmoratus]|nr:hypothetical protein EDC04DRAFT_3096001 [Pisolithus marmoratus]
MTAPFSILQSCTSEIHVIKELVLKKAAREPFLRVSTPTNSNNGEVSNGKHDAVMQIVDGFGNLDLADEQDRIPAQTSTMIDSNITTMQESFRTNDDLVGLGIFVTALDSIGESVTMQHLGFGLEFQDSLSAALTRSQSQSSVVGVGTIPRPFYMCTSLETSSSSSRPVCSSLKEKGGMLTLNASRHRTGHGPGVRAWCQFKALTFETGYGSDIKWIRSRGRLNEHTRNACLMPRIRMVPCKHKILPAPAASFVTQISVRDNALSMINFGLRERKIPIFFSLGCLRDSGVQGSVEGEQNVLCRFCGLPISSRPGCEIEMATSNNAASTPTERVESRDVCTASGAPKQEVKRSYDRARDVSITVPKAYWLLAAWVIRL